MPGRWQVALVNPSSPTVLQTDRKSCLDKSNCRCEFIDFSWRAADENGQRSRIGESTHHGNAPLLRRLSDAQAADVLDEFAPDDAADVIGSIKAEAPERAHPILVEMDRAGDVQALLAFLPDTAGGRMTTDFLAVRPDATAEDAIRTLRERVGEGEFRGFVYVTDEARVLVGVVPLYRLVLVDPVTRIANFMVVDPVRVRGTDDQEDVAHVFRERRFLAVPVVDLEVRLIGVVTADDAADVVEKEATEDIERLGGF